jgi:hypothetical protein
VSVWRNTYRILLCVSYSTFGAPVIGRLLHHGDVPVGYHVSYWLFLRRDWSIEVHSVMADGHSWHHDAVCYWVRVACPLTAQSGDTSAVRQRRARAYPADSSTSYNAKQGGA